MQADNRVKKNTRMKKGDLFIFIASFKLKGEGLSQFIIFLSPHKTILFRFEIKVVDYHIFPGSHTFSIVVCRSVFPRNTLPAKL